MSRLSFKVRLRLLPTELGGRKRPIFGDYRPNWDLRNMWRGRLILNDGRVLLDGIAELAPSADGPAFIEPLVEEFWGAVDGSQMRQGPPRSGNGDSILMSTGATTRSTPSEHCIAPVVTPGAPNRSRTPASPNAADLAHKHSILPRNHVDSR